MNAVDVTWLMGPVFIWSTIEPSVAIVCACLPHLSPLTRLAHRSVSNSLYHSKESTTVASGRAQKLPSGSGHGVQRSNIFGNLDYGLDQRKKNANDDEISLTNYSVRDGQS